MTTLLLMVTLLTQFAGFSAKRSSTFNPNPANSAAGGDQGSSRLSDRPLAK
jgi:hypothetical protein